MRLKSHTDFCIFHGRKRQNKMKKTQDTKELKQEIKDLKNDLEAAHRTIDDKNLYIDSKNAWIKNCQNKIDKAEDRNQALLAALATRRNGLVAELTNLDYIIAILGYNPAIFGVNNDSSIFKTREVRGARFSGTFTTVGPQEERE
jgi:chromosome segregation ATPase